MSCVHLPARRDTTIIVTLDTEKEIIIDPATVEGVRTASKIV